MEKKFYLYININMNSHPLDQLRSFIQKININEIIIYAMILATIDTIGTNILKVSKYGSLFYFVGISCYVLLAFFLHWVFLYQPSKVIVIWSSMSVIFAIFWGYFLYNENINISTVMSLLFALLSVYFSYTS